MGSMLQRDEFIGHSSIKRSHQDKEVMGGLTRKQHLPGNKDAGTVINTAALP